MGLQTLGQRQVRDLLLKNWMTHDALWYGEAILKLGMAEASPMNIRVCRALGRIECKRLMRMVGAVSPEDMDQYRALFEVVRDIFVPDFMKLEIEYPGHDTQVVKISECFAHKGMEKLGVLAEYECGIFERIEGWFDAMGLRYTRTPDLSRCLKYTEGACTVTVKFHFE